MAEAVVIFLLEQLKEVVVEYTDLTSGAEKEFEQLKDDLDLLKAFLKDAAKKTKKDNISMELERRIRDLVYELEDTIDTCLTRAIEAEAKAKNSKRPAFLSTAKRYSLAKEVNSIKEGKLKKLFEDAQKFASMQQISDGSSGGVKDQPTQSKRDTPIRKNTIVGFEDEERTITGYLKEHTEKLDVISIVGIPGQGKTTLAWKIYDSENIRYHFPIRIWVYISQVFSCRDVLLQIMKKFTPSQDPSNLSDDDLAQTVRVCLEKEKFLLVLDDVWSVDSWNKIKEVLPENNGDGKVLITSRQTDVGIKSKVYRDPHNLRFLDDDESWRLLQYEVYGNLEECKVELRSIGQHIATKCDGVPLTIVVIGGILVDQLTSKPSTAIEEEWVKVSENVMSVALQKDKAQRITDVVALSYDRLRDDLRDCFVYLGVFPEDYEIPVQMLCGLWIAEGFILPQDTKSLEEIAEENLNDLICRNLLKVEKTNHMGKAKTCRVHDMIRAFCMTKSKEQDFFQEIKMSKTGVSEVQKLHRLCFHSDLNRFLSTDPAGPHVRSFLCFYKQPVEVEPNHIAVIPDGFAKLRILESKSIKFHQFPAKITKLIHLRYLTLFIDDLKIIPQQISQLWNLQSLVVQTTSRSIVMKANMWRMIRLRHLKTNAAITLDNKWEGKSGQNLHTLNRLAPESCTEAVSKKAKNLKTLGVSGKLAKIFASEVLGKFDELEKLKLVNSLSEDVTRGLLKGNCFPPNLKRLTLSNTSLVWQDMSILAKIKTLEALKLKDNAFVGVKWINGEDDKFHNLQLLLIVQSDFVVWDASTDSFPKLTSLVVKNCENLQKIPEGLGRHLDKLEIDRVRKSVVESARKIEEINKDRPKGKFEVPFKLIVGPSPAI